MTELKTVENTNDAQEFIDSLDDLVQRADSKELIEVMSEVSGHPPVMWGSAIIGFDKLRYKSKASEGDWPVIAFSPRKGKLSLYLTYDASLLEDDLKDLGKHKVGKGCLYINRLSDIDRDVLKKVIIKAYENSGFAPTA